MLRVSHPQALVGHAGQELGASQWRTVSQKMIDSFANVTGDTHWIHTDPARAAAEGPFGGTIAHGFMTLALITSSMSELLEIGGAAHFVNYGLDRVRFTGPVRAGSRVRLRQSLGADGADRRRRQDNNKMRDRDRRHRTAGRHCRLHISRVQRAETMNAAGVMPIAAGTSDRRADASIFSTAAVSCGT